MNNTVKNFVSTCPDCQSFVDKKTSEPLSPHTVPEKNWSKVAVDLFGEMPSKNHVVVIQDLASRFPAAKLVKSTKSSNVLPAMADIYDNFGNPEVQLSDNGPPFNSQAMRNFCEARNIVMEKTPPLHPSANPAETFMKSVGKTMKIASQHGTNEKEALTHLLTNYRDTPHPSTGVTPNDMLFRDPPQTVFPRRDILEHHIQEARQRDSATKHARKEKINSSKYRQKSSFGVGDTVLIRNYNKTSKYDPYFQYSPLTVTDIQNDGRCLTLQRHSDGRLLQRHPDDVKMYHGSLILPEQQYTIPDDEQCALHLQKQLQQNMYIDHDDEGIAFSTTGEVPIPPPPGLPPPPGIGGRPVRQCRMNPRYYNDNMVNR